MSLKSREFTIPGCWFSQGTGVSTSYFTHPFFIIGQVHWKITVFECVWYIHIYNIIYIYIYLFTSHVWWFSIQPVLRVFIVDSWKISRVQLRFVLLQAEQGRPSTSEGTGPGVTRVRLEMGFLDVSAPKLWYKSFWSIHIHTQMMLWSKQWDVVRFRMEILVCKCGIESF